MKWTKTKQIIAISASVLLAGAAAALSIYEIRKPVEGIPKGWSVIRGDVDQWNWAEGKIHGHSISGESLLVSSEGYRNVTLSAMAGIRNREASLVIRMEDADNGYLVIFGSRSLFPDKNHIVLIKRKLGQEQTLATYEGRIFDSLGSTAKLTVSAKGPWLEVRLNDVSVIRVKDADIVSGFIGLRTYGDPSYPCDSTFSNVSFH